MMNECGQWPRPSNRMIGVIGVALLVLGTSGFAGADGEANPGDINDRLYQQLDGNDSAGKIETVSGQMYIPQEQLDTAVINDALSAMLAASAGAGSEASVSVRHGSRLNFEIHFKKNSADLTDESRRGLDQLGEVLGTAYLDTRFILGGHTDLDGDETINGPLSQARADTARNYLVETYDLASDRIVAQGFGTSEPLREIEKSAQDKLYNRRVDLRPIRSEP